MATEETTASTGEGSHPPPELFPAPTFEPPYYAAIFTSVRRLWPDDGYGAMAGKMVELATQMPGFLGLENVSEQPYQFDKRSAAGNVEYVKAITISYWKDDESVRGWKKVVAHLGAQKRGKKEWYERYEIRVGKIERAYGFERDDAGSGGQAQI